MDKEKYINKLNEELDELKGKELLYFNMRDSVQEARCTNRIFGIQYALNCARLLDEPQKVKVKQFVADWFEKNKDDLEFNIWRYIRNWNEQPKDGFQMFMNDGPSKPIETLIRMQDGYEVEEEPEWVVRVKEMFFLNWGEDGTCPTFVIDDNPGAKRSAKPFIKSEAQSLAESLHGSIEKV